MIIIHSENGQSERAICEAAFDGADREVDGGEGGGLLLDRRLAAELGAAVYAPRVREDLLSGVRSGVKGTPTFFINGARYDGPRDVEPMVGVLEGVREGVEI